MAKPLGSMKNSGLTAFEAELQDIDSWIPFGIDYNTPLKTLEGAVKDVIEAEDYNKAYKFMEKAVAAKEKGQNPNDGLTHDESASIRFYTTSDGTVSRELNKALRDKDRNKLKPWHSLLHLFLIALSKLP